MVTSSILIPPMGVGWNRCWALTATWIWCPRAATKRISPSPWRGFATMTGTRASRRLRPRRAAQRRAVERPGGSVANGTGHQEARVRIAKADPHPPSFTRRSFNVATKDASDCYSCGVAEMPHVPGCLRGARHRNWNFPGRGHLHTVFAHCRVRNIVDIFHPQSCTLQTKLDAALYRLSSHQRPIQPMRVSK